MTTPAPTPTLTERLKSFLQTAESIDKSLVGTVHAIEQSWPVQQIEHAFPASKELFAKLGGPEKVLEAVGVALPQLEMGVAAFEIFTKFGKPMDANDMAVIADDKTHGG